MERFRIIPGGRSDRTVCIDSEEQFIYHRNGARLGTTRYLLHFFKLSKCKIIPFKTRVPNLLCWGIDVNATGPEIAALPLFELMDNSSRMASTITQTIACWFGGTYLPTGVGRKPPTPMSHHIVYIFQLFANFRAVRPFVGGPSRVQCTGQDMQMCPQFLLLQNTTLN